MPPLPSTTHSKTEINKVSKEVISTFADLINPAALPNGIEVRKKLPPKVVKSIKDAVRAYFTSNPTEFKAFVQQLISLHPGLVWQMLEGKPPQDITSGGLALPTPILNVLIDNSKK